MQHYQCAQCSWFCIEPVETSARERSEHFGQVAYVTMVELSCPECGGDVSEQAACLACASVPPLSGYDTCFVCLDPEEQDRVLKSAAQ